MTSAPEAFLQPTDTFSHRHIGPDETEVAAMLAELRLASLDELIDETIPAQIRVRRPLKIGPARAERELGLELRALARENRPLRSLIGQGYHGTIVPGGDPAQRAREPGLVHAVHALPGRDLAGPPRGAARTSRRWSST